MKKRLQRGLEQARVLLARRGVAIGVGLLGGLLAGQAGAAAPAAVRDRLVTLAQAPPSPAVATLASGASPMTLSATLLIPATLTMGAILVGVAGLALPHRVPSVPAAEVVPADPVALAVIPTWPATPRGCWYLSLLDWRFERDQYSPPGLERSCPSGWWKPA